MIIRFVRGGYCSVFGHVEPFRHPGFCMSVAITFAKNVPDSRSEEGEHKVFLLCVGGNSGRDGKGRWSTGREYAMRLVYEKTNRKTRRWCDFFLSMSMVYDWLSYCSWLIIG